MTYVHRCPCGEPQVACCCHLRAPARLVDDPNADAASRAAVTLLADETVDDSGDAAFERVRAEVRRRLARYVGGAS